MTMGTALWRETIRRLAEGPNTAFERRVLIRRRARLRRAGEDRYQPSFLELAKEHHQKMFDVTMRASRTVIDALARENEQLRRHNDALHEKLGKTLSDGLGLPTEGVK